MLEERNSRTPKSDDLGLLIGATKTKIWEYEKEVRFLLEVNSFDKDKFEYVNDKQNISVDFDISFISKVILGLKSSSEKIEKVVKVFCDKGHLPDFTRLDIDPLTLKIMEKDTGHKSAILQYKKSLQPTV